MGLRALKYLLRHWKTPLSFFLKRMRNAPIDSECAFFGQNCTAACHGGARISGKTGGR
jgi:hypothetical protein